MKCLILAAGYATRLYPLTENFPKPLLKVGEKTILDWLIQDIEGAGCVDEYIVISNHKFAPHFQEWALAHTSHITVIDDGTESNDTRLGAVRDIQLALSRIPQEEWQEGFLVIAGDNVLDFSLQHFISYAKRKGASCIMRFHEPNEERLHKSGIVEVDADDRILSMEEKPAQPKSHWICPPFYYYTQQDAHLVGRGIEQGCGVDAPGSFIAWLSTQVPVFAMEMPGRRYDIGNLASYEEVQRTYRGITV